MKKLKSFILKFTNALILCASVLKSYVRRKPALILFAASLRVSTRGASRREAGRSPVNSYFRSAMSTGMYSKKPEDDSTSC